MMRPDAATGVFLVSIGLLVAMVVLALSPPASVQGPGYQSATALAKPKLKAIPILVRGGRLRDG